MTVRSVDARIDALAHLSSAEIRAEWARVFRKPAPAIPIDLLLRELGYRLQERARGGLPSKVGRELDRLAQRLERTGHLNGVAEISLKPGTRLVREWQGRHHHVLVLDEGYLFEDRHYSSLSNLAEDITGAHWSGPRFFGLRTRGRASTGARSG